MQPISLNLSFPGIFGEKTIELALRGPVTTLIGPNGSGKSQVMRRLKRELQAKVGNSLLFPAGRLQPLEQGRLVVHPGIPEPEDKPSITLNENFRSNWFMLETVEGVLHRLAERIDIQIKVAERLRRLFRRELVLKWERGNLQISFLRGGNEYSSSREASGLLHLVAILSALYDNELKVVLLDEPEISLHPQLQSFVLREIERVSGDPAAGKKIVVTATHSASMLRLRRLDDLPNLIFFYSVDVPPIQVSPEEGALKNQKLEALIRTLGAGHREALFSARPLLVEGPSDELVVDALDAEFGTNVHAAGSQILPVTGVTKMAPAVKLLRLVGKKPSVLADLDAFTDDLDLVNALNDIPEGRGAAQGAGHGSLHEAAKKVHDRLVQATSQHWDQVAAIVVTHPCWAGAGESDVNEEQRKRRALAASLLAGDEEAIAGWPLSDSTWLPLQRQLKAVLDLLEHAGCFIQRVGTMEDTYLESNNRGNKLDAAASEAECITQDPASAALRHAVALRALRHVAQVPSIDESAAVAKAFVAVVAPALDELLRNPSADSAALQTAAAQHARESAALFVLDRADANGMPAVKVTLNAPVLDVTGFPLVVRRMDNINAIAASHIQPNAQGTSN